MMLLSLQNTPASLLGTPKRATVLRAVPPRNIRCRIYAHSSTSSSTSNSTTSKSASTSTSSSQLYKCMEKRVDVSPPPEASVWNPFQRAVAALLNKVDESISVLEKRYALSPTVDPNVQLAGNFAPVSETAEEDVLIHGTLPSCIENGVYVRNGANPMFPPAGGHHLFDGDGMLHAVSFKEGGRATYCCRYTRTYRLNLEEKLQRTVFPKAIGELHGHAGIVRLLIYYARACFGLVDLNQGMGVANAGVVYFNGRLLAMSEDDLPYHVQITEAGGLRTNGRYDFNGQLKFSTIAHPKLDPHTGELLTLSYDVLKKPYLRFLKFSPTGVKSSEVNISLQQPTMIHDFAITERFVIIPDQQVVFRLQDLLRGGSPVMHDKSKVSRFGVLPRGDSDESRIVWVDVPDCFCFHLWNAWEEEVEGELEEIVVIGSCMTPPDAMFNESLFSVKCVLSEIRLNLRTGTSTRRAIVDDLNLEAGQVNRNYLGRRSRYVYMSIVEPWPRVSGVAKVDLMSHKGGGEEPSNNVVAKITYPEGCYGGEPFFVPQNDSADEDDGYVLTYMHNEKTGESKVLVLDATSPSLKPVASVKLPSRVPYGFHGTFIASSDLERQTPPEI